jgi:hypothetical protein
MPKLSSFVKKKAGARDPGSKREEEEEERGESQLKGPPQPQRVTEAGRSRVTSTPQQQQRQPPLSRPAQASSAPQGTLPEIGIPKKALDEYIANKVFRWPDGSLRKEKPPAKKEVVLARRDWDDLVNYCRRTGGCPDCTKGYCLRHGVGVSAAEHEAYCRSIGVWNQPLKDMQERIYMEEQGLSSSLTLKYQTPVK